MLIVAVLMVAQLCRFDGYPACVAPHGDVRSFPECVMPSTNFWARGFDFSCVSPWNSLAGRLRAGTAISLRHVIFANHLPLAPGTRIVFVGEDGGLCPCSITKTKRVGRTDIMIGLLDYELTPNIKPARVMRADWMNHVGCVTNFTILTFNQNEQLLCSELSLVQTNVWPGGIWNHKVSADRVSIPIHDSEPSQSGKANALIDVPEEALQRKGMIRLGDSGNPAFLIYKGEPILLYCLSGGGCGSGSYIHQRLPEIQSAMDELAPGYKLTFAEITSTP